MAAPLAPHLSIIIPVYREADLALECLTSVHRSCDAERAEIIVVDDHSNDGTPDLIERRFPSVKLIRREVNGGFAAACNSGFAAADPDSPFVALLNSDTVVESGWASTAIRALEGDTSLGAVAPRVMQLDMPSVIDSAGLVYTLSGWAYRRGHGREYGPPFDQPSLVFGATGCATVFRRTALEGRLFREELGCYYEDVELALRLRRDGWKCLYLPESVVRHKGSATYSKRSATKAFHVSRNLEILFWEHLSRHDWRRAIPAHYGMTAAHALVHLARGQIVPFIKGKIAARQLWRL